MTNAMAFIRRLALALFAGLIVALPMPALADRCSSWLDGAWLNEYMFGSNPFLEVYSKNPAFPASWQNWTIDVYDGTNAWMIPSVTLNDSTAFSCTIQGNKSWVTYPVSSNRFSGGQGLTVLKDEFGNYVDVFAFGGNRSKLEDAAAYLPVLSDVTNGCPTLANRLTTQLSQIQSGASSAYLPNTLIWPSQGNKDYARQPDGGNNNWYLTSETGSGTTFTSCTTNNGNLSKSVDYTDIAPGGTVNFLVTMKNTDSTAMSGVTIVDTLPIEMPILTLVSATGTGTLSYSAAGDGVNWASSPPTDVGYIRWQPDSIPGNSSTTLVVTMTVPSDAVPNLSTYTNNAATTAGLDTNQSDSITINVIPATTPSFVVGASTTCASGASETALITVRAFDGASGTGNPLTSYTGTVTLSTSTGTGTWSVDTGTGTFTAPNKYTFAAGDNGQATFLLTATSVLGMDVTATDVVWAAPATMTGTTSTPISCAASVPHHLRIEHDGDALTCMPESVTVKACANSACDTLFTTFAVSTTLAGGGAISFTGSTTTDVGLTTAGTLTLATASTSPVPTNPTRCFIGATESCALIFSDAGFSFDIPNLTAGKTSGTVAFRAVKKADNSVSCAPAFTGSKTVHFWSDYATPNTGTRTVSVNGSAVATASTGTGLALTFDSNGEANLTVSYADAGLMQLNARYDGSGADGGLVMTGADQFVASPAGFCVQSGDAGADCASGDASCSAFTRAGSSFNLAVKAVAWQSDADTDLCSGNSTTPNFILSGVALGHTLVAPVGNGASNGTLGVGSVDFASADAGTKTVSQSISEVGVFTFSASPPANAYHGLTVPGGTSANIGRFFPARLMVTDNGPLFLPDCGAVFTYLGDDFGFAASPVLTVTAVNAAGATTINYDNSFWKLSTGLVNRGYAKSAGATTAAGLTRTTDGGSAALAGNTGSHDGQGTLTVTGDLLTYSRPVSEEAPFDAEIDLTFTAADLNDGDACYDLGADGTCDPYAISSIGGTQMRWGRLALDNAYGAELVDLGMTLRTEYFDGNAFISNTADNCTDTTIILTDGDLAASKTCVIDNGSGGLSGAGCSTAGTPGYAFSEPPIAGNFNLWLQASGAGNTGTVNVSAAGPAWLQYDWSGTGPSTPSAKASFGLYSGSNNIIYIRERY